MKNPKQFIGEYEAEVFILIILTIWMIGASGFMNALELNWSLKNAADACYLSLQLFVMNSGAMDIRQYSYELEFARWSAPLCLAAATIRTVLMLAKERKNKFRLRFMRDHVVICGLGAKGAILASDLAKKGRPLVVIDADSSNPLREAVANWGGIVLIGDATDPVLLERARIHRASSLVALTGQDEVNLRIAQISLQIMKEHIDGMLECLVHVHNADLRRLFYDHTLFDKTYASFDARLFDCYEKGARKLLQSHFASHLANVGAERTEFRQHHLLLVGFGWLCRSIAVQAARTGCYPDGKKLRVTIIDLQAEFLSKKLKKEILEIDQLLDIRFYSLDARLLPLRLQDLYALPFHVPGIDDPLEPSPIPGGIDMAFVGLGNDLLEYAASRDLSRWFLDRSKPPEIIFCPSEANGFAKLISEEPIMTGNVVIRAYRMLEEVCSFDAIVNPQLELLARTIHYDYVYKELGKIKESNALEKTATQGKVLWEKFQGFMLDFSDLTRNSEAMKKMLPQFTELSGNPCVTPWEALSEEMKDANREQAEHICVKLGLIGCTMVDEIGKKEPCEMTSEETNMLARVEHARWMSDKIMQGWKYGKTRDNIKKINPLLVPYDDLEQSEQDKDIEAVRNIPRLVALLGKFVVRGPSTSQTQ